MAALGGPLQRLCDSGRTALPEKMMLQIERIAGGSDTFLVGAFLADVFLTNVFRVRLADDLRAALVMVRPSRISVPGQDKA